MSAVLVPFFPVQRKGRLPACFSRLFGLEVAPFVTLRDPNGNEIEVSIVKRNGRVYFDDGWSFLQVYYGISTAAWITVIYANRHLFLIEVRSMHGEEYIYPDNDPPQRMLLQNDKAMAYRNSPIPYGPVAHFLPTSFYHTIIKELTFSDVYSGVLVS